MTLNVQSLEGSWDEVKAKIRERWGKLTDKELQRTRGSAEQLIGLIQLRTGETRANVVSYLESTVASGSTLMATLTELVKDYFHSAGESVRDTTHNAMESVRAGYEEAEEFVEGRPMESVAVAFGAGFIAGVILTCLFSSSHSSGAR